MPGRRIRRMKRIMVTGAVGQIGSELTLALRERYGNDNVVACGRKTQPSPELRSFRRRDHRSLLPSRSQRNCRERRRWSLKLQCSQRFRG